MFVCRHVNVWVQLPVSYSGTSTVCLRQDPVIRSELVKWARLIDRGAPGYTCLCLSHCTLLDLQAHAQLSEHSSPHASHTWDISLARSIFLIYFIQLKLFYTGKFVFFPLFSKFLKLVALLKDFTTFQSRVASYFPTKFYLRYLWIHKIYIFLPFLIRISYSRKL